MSRTRNFRRRNLELPAASACRGFTLIELSVALVLMSLLFVVVLPAMQQVRQRESHNRAGWRLEQIATAMFSFHDALGVYPDRFEALQPFLDENLWTALVNDEPLEGSKFRMHVLSDSEIKLFTVVHNPMRVTQTLSMTLREEDAAVFQTIGEFPRIVSTTDHNAVVENEVRMHQVMDRGLQAVKCAGGFGEADTSLEVNAAWQTPETRAGAWELLDQDDDGFISRSEVFDIPWDTFPVVGGCVADFINFAEETLAFEEDEPDYSVPIVQNLLWRHALLDRLYGHVEALRAADETQPTFIPLAISLDQIGTSLRTADLDKAVRQVGTFERTVKSLVLGGAVPDEFGGIMLTTATLFDVALIAQLFTIPDPARPLESPVVLRVDWRAAGPGSLNDPFPDIVSAAAFAAEQGFPAIEIVVRPGAYRGSLAITLHTRIRGQPGINFPPLVVGRVVNEGPFALELLDLWLTSEDQTPGVISVRHPEASTYLAGVKIANALGFAIHQTGGAFRCHELIVDTTSAYSADLGVAVQFDGGAQVELKDVQMQGNRAGALLLSGAGTQAYVNNLEISKTRANAYALDRIQEEIRGNPDYDYSVIQPGTCALDVRNGAYLEGECVRLIDNEYVGLIVHGLGRAVLSDSQISSTSQVTQVPGDQSASGYNVVVFDQGILEMTSFTVSHAFVGLNLNGFREVRLRGTNSIDSVVSFCDVGVAVGEAPPNFDLADLEEGIDYQNNEVNLRSLTLPLPGVVSPAP
jgi:prepilin-type N-terminal cleavage/methylation domain-containing protein